VSVAETRALTSPAMGHVTEDAPRIAHNLVRSMSFDVTDEPDTTHPTVGCGIEVISDRERCYQLTCERVNIQVLVVKVK